MYAKIKIFYNLLYIKSLWILDQYREIISSRLVGDRFNEMERKSGLSHSCECPSKCPRRITNREDGDRLFLGEFFSVEFIRTIIHFI